jgi:hypothetical protein
LNRIGLGCPCESSRAEACRQNQDWYSFHWFALVND